MTNPISVSDLGVALATRGWKATICDSREFGKLFPKEELVDVDPAGYLKCVDGRGSDAVGKQQHGPKMLGGVYGIALNRGIKTTKELEGICQERSPRLVTSRPFTATRAASSAAASASSG